MKVGQGLFPGSLGSFRWLEKLLSLEGCQVVYQERESSATGSGGSNDGHVGWTMAPETGSEKGCPGFLLFHDGYGGEFGGGMRSRGLGAPAPFLSARWR